MTFQLTYEELLARNEKLENAVQNAISELEHIEATLRDTPKQPLKDIIGILNDLIDWDILAARSKLEKTLQ